MIKKFQKKIDEHWKNIPIKITVLAQYHILVAFSFSYLFYIVE